MRTAAVLLATWLLAACGTRFATTAEVAGGSGGTGSTNAGSGGAPACMGGFEHRLRITSVSLSDDIRAKAPAYDLLERDERLAFALGADGRASVAWLNNAGNTVHVSSFELDGSYRTPDLTLPSAEVGGLIARDDGFMLLTSGPDPGDVLLDPNADNAPARRAALLTRFRNNALAYSLPLTGTAQIASEQGDDRRDCTPSALTGKLGNDGARYAAYFAVHGCVGHPSASFYGDKLVYVNDAGRADAGGFSWVCRISEGLALLPEIGPFTSLCMSEGDPRPGLNLVRENGSYQSLASEAHTRGYVGGQFGGVVRLDDGGYVIAWLSRGLSADGTSFAKQLPDIALMRVDAEFSTITSKTWLTDTPDTAEYNLHIASYGPNRVLLIWESVDVENVRGETGFGSYVGTFAQLFDANGDALSAAESIPARPSYGDDIARYANGDLGWAFVPVTRNYSRPFDANAAAAEPRGHTLSLARLEYCE